MSPARTKPRSGPPTAPPTKGTWSAQLRCWIECDGAALVGEGRADLLRMIERTHSISAAARAMRMSYRRAWMLVQAMNEAAGTPLVVAAVGGLHGGGAQLTDTGRRAMAVFDQLHDQLQSAAAGALPRILQIPTDGTVTLHLSAAISLQEAVGQVLTAYALRSPSVRVRATFGASNELADHIAGGMAADLFLSADASHVERLAAEQRVLEDSRRTLATNLLVAVAPAESTLPVRKPRDLTHRSVERLAVADPACPLGACTSAYLQSLGAEAALGPRMVRVDNSRAVLAAVRSGEATVGIAFASDVGGSGLQVLFRVRPADAMARYVGAVLTSGRHREAARELLDFFASPTARACLRRCGFQFPGKEAKPTARERA